ncbi:MAG: methyltransferase domain-containing protein [Candidatus Tyrphobacter sp.]
MTCRSCGAAVTRSFCDLGQSPLANSYVLPDRAAAQPRYPLHAYVCDICRLVQLAAFAPREEIFGEYAYFSSFSSSWLQHARQYADAMVERASLNETSLVAEVASNDGYLLQYFAQRGVPVLGVEPAENVAVAARERGVRTEARFFGAEVARALREEYGAADLAIANNVIAHVPDLHDFIAGFEAILAPRGTLTIEFPHLLRLIEGGLWDTIYHEHFSYFSLHALQRALREHALEVVDLDELATHGGSLRLYVRHAGVETPSPSVMEFLEHEAAHGLLEPATYDEFQSKAQRKRDEVLAWLRQRQARGERVVCYGAPAKGNTLLNFCGVTAADVAFTVDKNPHKQGHLLPGSLIPVAPPERLRDEKPDVVWILPWNLREEIAQEIAYVREWGGRFAVAMPRLEVFA